MKRSRAIPCARSIRETAGRGGDTRTASFRTSAEANDRHIGRYGSALARALSEIANVSAGQRALDVGCGPGALAAELCQVLGSDGLAAIDPSTPFVEACAQRLPGVDVRLATRQGAPLPRRLVGCHAGPTGGQLHERSAGGRARDAAGDATGGHGRRRGLGLRGRDDALASVLGRRGEPRPGGGREQRGPIDALLHSGRASAAVARRGPAEPGRFGARRRGGVPRLRR